MKEKKFDLHLGRGECHGFPSCQNEHVNIFTSCHAVVKNRYDDEEDVEPGENYQQEVEAVPHVLSRVVLVLVVFDSEGALIAKHPITLRTAATF